MDEKKCVRSFFTSCLLNIFSYFVLFGLSVILALFSLSSLATHHFENEMHFKGSLNIMTLDYVFSSQHMQITISLQKKLFLHQRDTGTL